MRSRAHLVAGAALACASALGIAACGDDEAAGCPAETEPLGEAEADLYRQLEVCASRITGVELHREDLPRVESDPETVACDNNQTGRCVTTPAGQAVNGYYLPDCDTFTVVHPVILVHEMLHPILCGVPELDCDGGHTSEVWTACQDVLQCSSNGRYLLRERVCDGTPDCGNGEDEAECP